MLTNVAVGGRRLPTLSVAAARGVKLATLYTENGPVCPPEDGKTLSRITDIPTAALKKVTVFQMHSTPAVVQALSLLVDPEAPDMLNPAEKRLVNRAQGGELTLAFFGNRAKMQQAAETLEILVQ